MYLCLQTRTNKATNMEYDDILLEFDTQGNIVETRSQIDQLFNEVEAYRNSGDFLKLLDFCVTFKEHAPFNAMLIKMQLPGCRYALTKAEWWSRYHRDLVPFPRPLFFLNHSPVGALYDISDTRSVFDDGLRDEDILEQVAHPFSADTAFDERLLDRLLDNLPYFGIELDMKMNAADSFAANIKLNYGEGFLNYTYRQRRTKVKCLLPYLISVNKNLSSVARFTSVCHELGHFFCHHLPPLDDSWWKPRRPDSKVMEFEAECATYLVCRRAGVNDTRSAEYLALYTENNGKIPRNISIETIMKAAAQIERMFGELNYTDCLLYKKDQRLKAKIAENNKRLQAKIRKASREAKTREWEESNLFPDQE